jgi:cell division protein FtsB
MPSTPRPRRSKDGKQSTVKLPKINLDQLNLSRFKLPKVDLDRLPKIPTRQVLIILGLGVMALVMLNLNSRLNEYNRLTVQREQIAAEVALLEATHQALETQVSYARSDAAVEDFAREAHLVRPGEVLVVPLPKPGQATQVPPEEIATPRVPQNWEVWWALFFEQ